MWTLFGNTLPSIGLMDTRQLLQLDRAHVWHPYAGFDPANPPYPVRGASGVRLELADGRILTACYAEDEEGTTGITGTFWDLPG